MKEASMVGQHLAQLPLEVASINGTSLSLEGDLAYGLGDNIVRHHRRAIAPPALLQPLFKNRAAARRATFFERLWGNVILSPFFLFSSLFVILFVPEKLVKKIAAPFTGIHFWERFGKRAFDLVMATLAFMLTSIMFLVVPPFIKLDSKGPVFYGQQRAGLNKRRKERRNVNLAVRYDRRQGERREENLFGRPFTVYKFRTMRADAEKLSGAVWAQKNDPRVTRSGSILRFTHVDEIPQFLNVLQGEMSMVGPRPERPQLIPKLVESIPEYEKRLEVKPGMTGIAQIYCGYDATIDDVRRKLRYDLSYVDNHSLKADILILWKTLWMIIRGRETAE
ncbi:MAG: sugar transferase [bacterium]